MIKKSEKLNFRLSLAQRRKLERMASQMGNSLGGVLTELIDRAAVEVRPVITLSAGPKNSPDTDPNRVTTPPAMRAENEA